MRYQLTCCMALMLLVGCSGRLPTVPVKGTLKIDDKPFGPASLTLSNPSVPDHPGVRGKVDASGTIIFSTYDEGDGAPEGSYEVSVLPDVMEMKAVPDVDVAKIEIKGGSDVTIALKAKSKQMLLGPKVVDTVGQSGSATLPSSTVGAPLPGAPLPATGK